MVDIKKTKQEKYNPKSLSTVLTLDSDNNLNTHFNRIRNLKDPKEDADAATKSFVINSLNAFSSKFEEIYENRLDKDIGIINNKIETIEQSFDAYIKEHIKYTEEHIDRAIVALNSKINKYYQHTVASKDNTISIALVPNEKNEQIKNSE